MKERVAPESKRTMAGEDSKGIKIQHMSDRFKNDSWKTYTLGDGGYDHLNKFWTEAYHVTFCYDRIVKWQEQSVIFDPTCNQHMYDNACKAWMQNDISSQRYKQHNRSATNFSKHAFDLNKHKEYEMGT